MLPKPNRLPSPEIRTVMRRGKRIANASMQFVFLPNRGNAPRFAFIVSTSIDKRATKRNRIKRVMRESVHRVFGKLHKSVDGILIARSKKLVTDEAQISKSLHELLTRAQLL